MKVKITRGKYNGINACADSRGLIAALAVDHRGGRWRKPEVDQRAQLLTAHASDLLRGIGGEAVAQLTGLLRVPDHRVRIIGADDDELGAGALNRRP